ncbi:OmpW/AlkL family protein [Comamonas aquatica]|uniref:OmpW/AlkL family protein n=1 Tax=Comamonas aquatica TaxID=225991 RepID=UPI00244BFD77|nr:OmpW family protein [Comamonas aquatica]MDH0380493.1 OmpW family protein [Comamonas aquatica]MDH0429032.1 OmpW family protein [Comamonas aquatica]MDH0941325.1 OmpW family protein [Comamonas aquatica]MDH1766586.1 OmpW family protein [Comamonas aquatica]
MKKTLLAVAALCAMTSGAAMAQQQDGKWQVRVRAVNLDAANKGEAATGAAGVSINDKVIPELDISYYFTPNFAAELVLTYPQKQDVRSNGVKIGSLKHLPPTLLAQYHFTNFGAFKPYVGAGINYTRFSNVDLPGSLDVKRNSWGGALQVGFDYALDKNWSLNFDVKKVYIDTTINSGIGKFKVDPILVGVGVGYRF